MPSVKVKSSTGTLSFSYVISTPAKANAKHIDAALPTVLFIHPVYIAKEIFQPQFNDPNIRRFNLVTLDLRGHGETGGKAKKYGQEAAAEDVSKFMDALKLPPCHVVGLSMGTIIALQLAVSQPKKVLSLFLISPLGLEEPTEVAEGRQEICDYWIEGLKSGDELALQDAVHGCLQLGYNNQQSSLLNAMTAINVPSAAKNWTVKDLDWFTTCTVKLFTERKEHPQADLAKLTMPVKMLHCMADIAYTLEYSEKFLHQLQGAGVKASLETIPDAPHFGSITNPAQVNPILYDFLLKSTPTSLPAPPASVTSPFEEALVKAGWDRDMDED